MKPHLILAVLLLTLSLLRADDKSPATPYQLPWPADTEHFCIQGNDGIVSHHGSQRYAWDFTMPVGTPVRAARAGTVTRVIDTNDGNGTSKPNNLVAIDHGDGTTAYYLHLRRGGASVKPGQKVLQGEKVAESGNVGRSMLPHLHFHVRKGKDTIPVTFIDVPTGKGVPITGKTYRSRK